MTAPEISPHYSFKTLRLASILLTLGVCFCTAAHAQGEFSVDKVEVEASGTNATDARAKALAQGEMTAFRQLVARRNASNTAEILGSVRPAEVSEMIRGYEIAQEKITADHYQATVRYNFNPELVQKFLGNAPLINAKSTLPATAPAMSKPVVSGTPALPAPAPAHPAASEQGSKAVLVLPVYNEGGGAFKLWQEDNKWRSLWYDAALESGGGLVIAPLGDLDDRVDVDDSNVDNANSASLAHMYGRYGVGEIDEVSAFYNLKADPKPALEVTLRQIPLDKKDSHTTHMSYTIRSTETLNLLMIRASNDLARTLLRQQTINPNKVEYERLKEIAARFNTSDIREWESLRQRLLARSNIVSVRLTSVSYYETSMIITFKGTPDMLGKTLVASGLRVMQDGDSLVLALQ